MKKLTVSFLKRGLMAAAGGPLILAVIYACLAASGKVTAMDLLKVCTEIITVTVMAFIAAGVGVVYSVEKLPMLHATLIHAAALYADYLLIYLFNEWIPRSARGIGVFTLIYVCGYAVIWLFVLFSIKMRIRRLNRCLKEEKA